MSSEAAVQQRPGSDANGPPCGTFGTFTERLDRLLEVHYPHFRQRIVADPGDRRAVPFAELLAGDTVDGLLTRFAAGYPGQDRRAVASLWSQWYIALTWAPLTGAALVFGGLPRLDPDSVALIVDDSGRPDGLVVPEEIETAPLADQLEALVRGQGAPLLAAVARAGGVSPRVPWSNGSTVLAWALGELQEHVDAQRWQAARTLLEHSYWADGTPNPLFVPDRSGPGPSAERRVCCLRYRLSDIDYCPNCPILRRPGRSL